MRQGRFASCKIFHSVTQLLYEGQPRSRRTRGRGESASRLGPVPSTSATFLSDGGASPGGTTDPGMERADATARPGPRAPLVRARSGLTVSPLNRTDTRAGSDPPSSRRAASIPGRGGRGKPVTSRCHLHGSEAQDPARPRR